MVTCVKCVRSFHIFCHSPALSKQQRFQQNWKCSNCSLNELSAQKNTNILGDNVRNNINNTNVQKVSSIMAATKTANPDTLKSKPPLTQSAPEKKMTTKQLLSNTATEQHIPARISNAKIITPVLTSSASATSQATVTTTIRFSSQEENKLKNAIKKPRLDEYVGIPPLKMINNNKETLPGSSSKMVITSSSSKNGIGSSSSTSCHNHVTIDGFKGNIKRKTPVANEQLRGTVTSSSSSSRHNISEEPIVVPDVKNWSVDQVADYFAKYFPNEAQVFRDQEIDGMSLLLLKRSDIVKKLPFKLGPSLRLYSFILKIQTKLNDPTLGWHTGSSSQ